MFWRFLLQIDYQFCRFSQFVVTLVGVDIVEKFTDREFEFTEHYRKAFFARKFHLNLSRVKRIVFVDFDIDFDEIVGLIPHVIVDHNCSERRIAGTRIATH